MLSGQIAALTQCLVWLSTTELHPDENISHRANASRASGIPQSAMQHQTWGETGSCHCQLGFLLSLPCPKQEMQPERTLSGLMGSRWHSLSQRGAGQARTVSSSLHQSHLHPSYLLCRMRCTVSHVADVCGHRRLEKVGLEGAEKSWCIKRGFLKMMKTT